VILFALVTASFPFADAQDAIDIEYDMPAEISYPLNMLFLDIFQYNPDLRATMEQVASSQWVMSDFDDPVLLPSKLKKGAVSEIRFDLINMMIEEFGVPQDVALRACNEDREYNRYSAMYKILRQHYPQLVVTDEERIRDLKIGRSREQLSRKQRRRLHRSKSVQILHKPPEEIKPKKNSV
jgi:hypothetical protein